MNDNILWFSHAVSCDASSHLPWRCYAVTGFVFFGAVGMAVIYGERTQTPDFQPAFIFAAVGAAIVGIVSIRAGQAKTFKLRLEAQTILCQRQVELNTKSSGRNLTGQGQIYP